MSLLRSTAVAPTAAALSLSSNGDVREADAQLAAKLRLRAWDRVLILGSGDGWLAEEACRRLTRGFVCGLDPSEANAAETQRLRGVPERLRFLWWDCRTIPFWRESFDHVVGRYTLGARPEPAELLREAARVLRPAGSLYLLESLAQAKAASRVRSLVRDLGPFDALSEISLSEDSVGAAPHPEPAVFALGARRKGAGA